MNRLLIISILILSSARAVAQITSIEEKFELPSSISESSGSIFFNDKLIVHNDSGNDNKLHELDTLTGIVARTVVISNATNIDWEDLAEDENSIFIGDIGNNSGDRTDLKIYKISKDDYLTSDTITSEILEFNYSDQVDFTSSPNNTTWDSEALISFDSESLIVFSKNWIDGETKAYSIPKASGSYTITPLESTLNTQGMITGATFNQSTNKVYLIGYNSILMPLVWSCENFSENDIFSGTNTLSVLSVFGLEQTESISHIGADRYFVTSESFNVSPVSDYGKLIAFTTNDSISSVSSLISSDIHLYPNPVKDLLHINGASYRSIEIYDSRSLIVFRGGYNKKLNLSDLSKGLYLVRIHMLDDTFIVKKIIKD